MATVAPADTHTPSSPAKDKFSSTPPLPVLGKFQVYLKWMHFVAFLTFGFQALMTTIASSAVKGFTISIGKGYTVTVQSLVSTYFAIVSLHHLSMLTDTVNKKYVEGLAGNQNMYRWYEYTFTSSIMVTILGFLSGVENVPFLIMLFVNMALVIWTGAWAEVDKNRSWFPHLCSWLLFFHLWGQIFLQRWKLESAVSFVQDPISEVINGTSTHTAMDVVAASQRLKVLEVLIPYMFFLFCMFGVVQTLDMLRIGPWKNYVAVEVSYVLLSLTTKTAMGFIVLHSTFG
jgi:hypothetical protein